MKLAHAISITMGFSAGCLIAGTTIKQPILRNIGEVAGLGSIAATVLLKQQHIDIDKQNELDKQQLVNQFQKNNTHLQTQLVQTQKELAKILHKVQTQDTRHRLYISNIQKLQHQQKLISGTVINLEHELAKQDKAQTLAPSTSKSNISTHNTSKFPIKAINQSTEPVTRVYIDGNNLYFGAEALQIEIDYDALRAELSQTASRTTFKYYTGIHAAMSETQKGFISYLESLRYEIIGLPILRRPDNKFKTVGDDIKIAVDILKEVKDNDIVILISGDGDFIPVIEEIQRRNVKVIVVAKKSMLSEQLQQIANQVIFLDDIQYNIAKYSKLNVA